MAVGRLIKAGLTGVTVFLWILMVGLLTGCGSRSGEIAEEAVQDENIETEAPISLPETAVPFPAAVTSTSAAPAVMPAAPFPTVPPDAPVRTDGIDGSFGIGSASILRGKNILVSLFLTTPDNTFTEEEKKICLQRLKEAAIYHRRNCFRLRRGNPVYSGLERRKQPGSLYGEDCGLYDQ